MPCGCGVTDGSGANQCDRHSYPRMEGNWTFSRGSDGKCTQCCQAEGDHFNHNGQKYCGRWCCNCGWSREDQRGIFAQKACKQCQKRRDEWGGLTTQLKFDEARKAEEAEAKRKAEEEAKRKAEARAEACAALGLAPSASDEEVAQAQKLKAYIVTPSGSEMKDWLLSKGFAENDRGRILLQFLKPEYEVTTLMELFALEDADIDEILEGLPLAKRRALKKHIKQDRDGI
jgi:hypothetical protein